MSDPFTQVYEKLWECLENDSGLSELIRSGNRIKRNEGAVKQDKERKSDRDFPELRIEPSGGSFHVQATNTSVPIVQKFEVICTTGDLRIDRSFFPVKWALLNALSSINNDIGLKFVRRISLDDIADSRNTEKKDGWNTVFEISVEMWFQIT